MNAPLLADTLAEPYVLRTDAGSVATLTLNRGARFNPLSTAMIAALHAELNAIASSNTVRVVIIAANGRGFCAGHDLKEVQSNADSAFHQRLFDECSAMMLAIPRLPQPVIARVNGIATAAGCQLVSMCDLAVASEDAQFALPGVNIGLFCSTPSVGVARNIHRKQAMEMLLTGDMISAAQAKAWGLVNRVVPAAALDSEIKTLTDAIVAKSGVAIALGKEAFYRQLDEGIDTAYKIAGEAMTCNLSTEDANEGIGAFLAKRAPVWKGK
jgi:enoyl-CoA hydratase/carnithine racemase